MLAGVLIAAALTFTAIASAGHTVSAIVPAPAFSPSELAAYPSTDWITAGGGILDDRYSQADQITKANVAKLQVAWHTHLGIPSAVQKTLSEEGAVLEYQGTLYVTDGLSNVYAIDATTGKILWKYHPVFRYKVGFGLFVNRGASIGNGLVYEGILDGSVVALNQMTGKVVWRHQLANSALGYSFTAAPVYYDGHLIIGVSGGDAGAHGFAVELNAATGSQLWRWYVDAAPGTPGGNSWPGHNAYLHGGALWIYPSVDASLGLVYLVTGNPVPWNNRGAGDDLYTDSIVALHVSSGKLAWYFQTVHHDIWDYDVTNPPVLFNAVVKGKMQPGLAVASKTGWVYILNRATGKPLIGIVEKKVPTVPGNPAGFQLSTTQPYPIGQAFVHQCSTRANWPTAAPDGKPFHVGCIFQPYFTSTAGSYDASDPSDTGGVDWAPSSYDPQTKYEYLCATDGAGASIGAIPTAEQKLVQGGMYEGVNFGPDSPVLANYGRVVAMNVTTNTIAWDDRWPQPCYSGTMSTATGLVFVGQSSVLGKPASKTSAAELPSKGVEDALDASTGKLLWSSQTLDAGANAPASTYNVNGRQYVVVLVGGNSLAGSKPGDSVYAFALPSSS
jgi:alcohol dehydrogenase (cytochrome c)